MSYFYTKNSYFTFCFICLILILVFFNFNKKTEKFSPGTTNDNKHIDNKISGNYLADYLLNDPEWSNILKGNSGQEKIDPKIILETLRFMISETEEDDPKLIKFVKSLINPPSINGIKLKNPTSKDFSQHGESLKVDKMLGGLRNGFLVEAGALDGETFSNSLFFERERNWSGILIEPLPFSYQNILEKKRNMYSINACIAKNKPIVAKFRMYETGAYSGRDKVLLHNKEIPSKFKYVYVPCFSLQTILMAINVKKVDFFSLDVEGGEWDVLNSIDFEKTDIHSFVIEHLWNSKEELANFLIKKNYSWYQTDKSNIYMLKN